MIKFQSHSYNWGRSFDICQVKVLVKDNKQIVVLTDMGNQGMSVTNGIEHILEKLMKDGYIDDSMHLDVFEINHDANGYHEICSVDIASEGGKFYNPVWHFSNEEQFKKAIKEFGE